jgi:hypothetical protein
MGAPVILHPALDLFDIEVRTDFLHKNPLVSSLRRTGGAQKNVGAAAQSSFSPPGAGARCAGKGMWKRFSLSGHRAVIFILPVE